MTVSETAACAPGADSGYQEPASREEPGTQGKRDTKVTGNQRASSDATEAVPRKADAVPHEIDPELWEREEKALRASSCDFPEDEGDAKTDTPPGESSQLTESGAEIQEAAGSKRLTRREVIGISFDEIKHTCLVRLRIPDSRPFTESRCQENIDECASGSESSSRLEDGRPQAGHPRGPATGGGCAGKGPTGDTMEPGRDKAGPTPVHPRTSLCSRHGASETDTSEAVMSKRPRPKWKKRRRISVVRSSSNASCKERQGKRNERRFRKRKRSSRLGGGKLQYPPPNEPRTQSSSASKEPGGGNNEPGTTQRGSRRSHSSSPVVQPGITSDGETKGDLRDCNFVPARKSKGKNLNSSSEAKNKLGVEWTPAWTSVASPAVRPRLSRDQCGLLPLKTLFLAAEELLRKASGDDLALPNRPALVNALEHCRQKTPSPIKPPYQRPIPGIGPLPPKPRKKTATMTTPPVVVLPVAARTPVSFHGEPYETSRTGYNITNVWPAITDGHRSSAFRMCTSLWKARHAPGLKTTKRRFRRGKNSRPSCDAPLPTNSDDSVPKNSCERETKGRPRASQASVEDVLHLMNRADPNAPEEKKLRVLMRGVKENIFGGLVRSPPTTVEGFITEATNIERALQARAAHYHRGPGVAAFSSSGCNNTDIREIIRDIVREELKKLLPAAERSSFTLDRRDGSEKRSSKRFQPDVLADAAPEPPAVTYAAVVRRPQPPVTRQYPAAPRREVSSLQYTPRQEPA
ncbi:hypothetical protein HPB47_018889 [Ixodes persulcatus]|uniref:Uncharacterized protein n=1 Tax=Ixodes persulcatus TaxID=34615 RepID=A0AC60QJS4_IXOPE|nr:hypothetical protein HPB47_018889 [Ixodes persulcatus]